MDAGVTQVTVLAGTLRDMGVSVLYTDRQRGGELAQYSPGVDGGCVINMLVTEPAHYYLVY